MRILDYKDWIAEKADEIAENEYGADFFDLPDKTKIEVYGKAELLYTDEYSALIDAMYEAELDRRLMEGYKDGKD